MTVNIYVMIWFILWPVAKYVIEVTLPIIFRDDPVRYNQIDDTPGIYWVMGAIWPLFVVGFIWDVSVGFLKNCCRKDSENKD